MLYLDSHAQSVLGEHLPEKNKLIKVGCCFFLNCLHQEACFDTVIHNADDIPVTKLYFSVPITFYKMIMVYSRNIHLEHCRMYNMRVFFLQSNYNPFTFFR